MSKEYVYVADWEDGYIYRVENGKKSRGNYETFIPWCGESGEWVRCAKGSEFDPTFGFDKAGEISKEEAKSRISDQIRYRKEKGLKEGESFSLVHDVPYAYVREFIEALRNAVNRE